MRNFLKLLLLSTGLAGCDSKRDLEQGADAQGHVAPSLATVKVNLAALENKPFSNSHDFTDAKQGLIAQDSDLKIRNAKGELIWNMSAYQFVQFKGDSGEAPGSVNPGLWRQAYLNNIHGLFKVIEGVYQVRGYDLANLTIIVGKTGWILVDPLTSSETSSRALLFAQKYLGKHPIKAILFTHSHIDHFGGINGILQNLSKKGKEQLRIIAPKGFMEEATSENIIAGPAMSRRAMYMYGKALARTKRGHVGSGLGKEPAFGSIGLEKPTELIDHTGAKLTIDGIPFEFQYVPHSEAPAEFTFYLPDQKAFGGAELLSHNMHNLYTLRGAKVRDAQLWSQYIEQARHIFKSSEVYFGSHHWPIWGRAKIDKFMVTQRDTFKFIHDQTVRLFNEGYTPNEIAEKLVLPKSLNSEFYNQGYYGTLKHNAKAVYQAYMGWFTGNPAMLDPLPEKESAMRYMAMMGGVDVVLRKAQLAYKEAENEDAIESTKTYRWLAELLNQAVFAEPKNKAVKTLLAKVYDQLGYQSESASWRDFYLTGAHELRYGTPKKGIDLLAVKGILTNTPVQNFFDSLAVRLNGPDAEGMNLKIKVIFTDLKESYLLTLKNSVLHHAKVDSNVQSDATLKLTHSLFVNILTGEAGLKETLFGNQLSVDGSRLDLIRFFRLFDKPMGTFNIVTP